MAARISDPPTPWNYRVGHVNVNPSVKQTFREMDKRVNDNFDRLKDAGGLLSLTYCHEHVTERGTRPIKWFTTMAAPIQNIPLNEPYSAGVITLPLTEVRVCIIASSADKPLPSNLLQYLVKKYTYLLVILSHQNLQVKSKAIEMTRLEKILKDNRLRLLKVNGPLSKHHGVPDLLIATENLCPHIKNVNSYEVTTPSFPIPSFISYVDIDKAYFYPHFDDFCAGLPSKVRGIFQMVNLIEPVVIAAQKYLPEYKTKKGETHDTFEHCQSAIDNGKGEHPSNTTEVPDQNKNISDKKKSRKQGDRKPVNPEIDDLTTSLQKADTIQESDQNKEMEISDMKTEGNAEQLGTRLLSLEVDDLIVRRRKAFLDFKTHGQPKDMEKYLELVELVKAKLELDK